MWRNRTFVLHTTAVAISALGTAGAQVATVFAVLGMGCSAGDVGVVGVCGLVPALAFFLVGGVVADRWPRNRVLVGTSALCALVQAGLGLTVLTGQARLAHVAVAAALTGVATAFARPAAQGLLLRGLGREEGPRAFAAFRLALNLAQIGGSSAGGWVVAAAGPGWTLLADALTFVVAIALGSAIPAEGTFSVRSGVVRELREGWTEFRAHRWLAPMVVQFAAVNALAVGAYELVLGPVVAADAAAWGLIMAFDATGMVLGGVLLLTWTPSRRWAVGGGALTAAPLVAMTASAPVAVVCLAAAPAGVGVEVFGVGLMTLLQRHVDRDRLSRVSAYQSLAGFGLTPAGTAFAGPLAAAAGARGALGIVAAVLLAVSAGNVGGRWDDARNEREGVDRHGGKRAPGGRRA
ncbi:Major Facilitator Superfamily protein [Amycolatopsis pretoriensis]|uniref:Major Facilitator Superfamily protein n=1 Tax=Amycolatopsis pretoriensis TaxID=218821 RepID=A0A1H5RD23_9PSEU|nr:Major Facilitator Superfamily protein [Amycolatopsis pretoriensis]